MTRADEFIVRPALISRKTGERIELAGIPASTGERALLVFASPEQAETFRAETGRFSAEEGFNVRPADLDGLETVIEVWGYKHVALRGPEPDTISELDAETFIAMLEEAGAQRA